MTAQIKKIMIVAGEQSGDILGAGLIHCLKKHVPECEFSGIGGPRMIDEGLTSHYPMERLSVMGFIDPLKRLPELLGIIKNLKTRFRDEQPDIFIGIDSPDFNIRLESAAKKMGIYSVHYVSPSVWAWRQGRVKKIKKSVDLMLALLPFEADFYKKHDVPVAFVGHPLADELPVEPDREAARAELGLPENIPICALMPGSRQSEVAHLLPLLLASAEKLRVAFPGLEFVLPAASSARLAQIKAEMSDVYDYIHVYDGCSHIAMTAANCVVMASGTTTLEAMLLKRPMVIVYRWPRLTWEILKRMVKVPWVGLPNLLSDFEIAPELLQEDATVTNIVEALNRLIAEGEVNRSVSEKFHQLHLELKRDASASAASAIMAGWSSPLGS